MVKKMIILILSIAILSAICIICFYVSENSKVVVTWLNGQTIVSNEDYEKLVESTNKTVSELNSQITDLENSNATLYSELSNITNLYNQELGKNEANEELLQNYLSQIETINAQLASNEEMLNNLTTLINQMCGQMLDSIIELPEEFQESNNEIRYIVAEDNDFFIYPVSYSRYSLYFFDFSDGVLTAIDSCSNSPTSFKKLNNGYIYKEGQDINKFDLETMTVTTLYKSAGSKVEYVDTSDGFYILSFNVSAYYSYVTDSFTTLNSVGYGSFHNVLVFDFDNDLFYVSGDCLHYINKATMEYSLISSEVVYNNCNIFDVGGEYVAFFTTNSVKNGCYKIDLTNFELITVDDSLSFTYSSGVVVNDTFLVYLSGNGLYTYKSGVLTKCLDSTYTSNILLSVLYHTEDYFLVTTNLSVVPGIYKVDSDGTFIKLYDNGYRWSYSYRYDDTLLIGSSVSNSNYYDLLSIDLNSFVATEFYKGSDGCYSIFIDLGDEIFISSDDEGYFLRLDKTTNSVDYYSYSYNNSLRYVELLNAKLYKSNSAYHIFLGTNAIAVYDRENDKMQRFAIDDDMSDLENGVFYGHFEELENGDLYYRYEIQNDLTIEKSLALFK